MRTVVIERAAYLAARKPRGTETFAALTAEARRLGLIQPGETVVSYDARGSGAVSLMVKVATSPVRPGGDPG